MGAGHPGPGSAAPAADLAERGSEGPFWPRRVILSGLSAWSRSPTGAAEAMSPTVKRDRCFSPVLCHCKAGCSNRTLSLVFGCKNRPPAVQGCPHPPQPVCMHPGCMNPALMNAPWYQYQEEDSVHQDHGFPRLTHEVQPPNSCTGRTRTRWSRGTCTDTPPTRTSPPSRL
ncbi:hypothetical protein AAFF_G00237840 [Aldrovandia affinis]|uniref:Uncharacterized protein n=1 Tax=Aldrovandia affinis TaxID=143900 RepID=A0AAD7REZ2_9TELE|nr:hypothetical protein AAFF_G00237840 [Aldrovandia affinis]